MQSKSAGFAIKAGFLALICLKATTATAQFSGGETSLGGYGTASGVAGSGMGGGPMVIPYGGMTEGFMPGRMGGGSSLSFRPRPTSTMGTSRVSSIFSTFPGGMSSTSRGTGTGIRSSMSNSMSSPGIGLRGGIFRSRAGGRGMGVMPPRIGYPFRQPPSLLGSSSSAAGMSM